MPDAHKEFEKKIKKSQNFGTKVDFFPLSEKIFKNFPNTKKIILPELHFKKIIKKIREPFSISRYQRLRVGCQVWGVAVREVQTTSAHFLRYIRLSAQNVQD